MKVGILVVYFVTPENDWVLQKHPESKWVSWRHGNSANIGEKPF
jgi:hypothetical protein